MSGPTTREFDWSLLHELVDEPGGSYDVAAIQRINTRLAADLGARGFAVTRHLVPGFGDCLAAELTVGSGDPTGSRITMVGHSDTVWPADFDPQWRFVLDAENGLASGPGVGDMKASLLLAADAAVDAARRAEGPALIRLLVIPDEEVGSVASRPWIDHYAARTDLCIGLEAGKVGNVYVTSRGAVGAMRISATGVPVHVTEPGGVNALDALLPLIERVRALSGPEVLVSVCHVRAGASRQITAGEAMFEIDLRADDAARLVATVDAIRAAADEIARTHPGTVEVTGSMTRPSFDVDRSARPWALLEELASGDEAPQQMHERGGSDASFFAAAGVPTIDGFGAICLDNCTRTERITTESVTSRARAMADLMVAWIHENRS